MNNDSERLIPSVAEPADPQWLLMATHQMYMRQVKNDEAEWFQAYEDADAMVFDVATAARLAMTAPSEYVSGLLMGRILLLREIQAFTQRETATTPVAA